jgi:hypothetical protein
MRPKNKEIMQESGCLRPFAFTSPRLGARFAIQIRSAWNAHLATLSRLDNIKFATLLAVLFLLTHPYAGIRHDAMLYTVQALHSLVPGNYKNDLFFEFGSQDDWTLFGHSYGRLIAVLGVSCSNLLCLVASQILWWTGMCRLAKDLLPRPWHWLCLLFVASMPAYYGSSFVFSYDEMFVSARLPAEGLSLWALAFVVERKRLFGAATAAFAMLFHPLVGALSLGIVLLIALPRVNWWRILLVGVIAIMVMELLPLPVLRVAALDAAWSEVVRRNVDFLFPSHWTVWEWSKACWVIALPTLLWVIESPSNRTLWKSLSLAGVAGLALSALADLIGHDAIFIQLQTWRVLWILTVMQWPALGVLIYKERGGRPMLFGLLAVCWLLLDVGGGVIAAFTAVLLHAERLPNCPDELKQFPERSTAFLRIVLLVATAVAIPIWVRYQCAYYHAHKVLSDGKLAFGIWWIESLIHTQFVIGIIAIVVILALTRPQGRNAILFAFIVLGLFTYGCANIDQRSKIAKFVESTADSTASAPFSKNIPPGATIYWEGVGEEITIPWIVMRTSSYFSPVQAAGMIFHRATTFEALRRLECVIHDNNEIVHHGKREIVDIDHFNMFADYDKLQEMSVNALTYLCDDPILDFVALKAHYAGLATAEYRAPQYGIERSLYDCKTIRSLPQIASGPSSQKPPSSTLPNIIR